MCRELLLDCTDDPRYLTVRCSFQQSRVDPNTPSEEFTTAAIIVDSWMRVRGSVLG